MSIRVKVFCVNEGTPSQYYGLINAEENSVISYSPNNWKTETGAKRWAKKNGYIVIENYTPYDRNRLKELKDNYYKAKAEYKQIKEKTDEIKRAVLADNLFYVSNAMRNLISEWEGNERILDPIYDECMSVPDYDRYLDICYEEYEKAGITESREIEYSPEYEAREKCIKAENDLISYYIDITPLKMKQKEVLRKDIKNYKFREKMLDLILRLDC